ncbi:MAG: hypothetical protein U0894_13370 [Pirellulales bacterium]
MATVACGVLVAEPVSQWLDRNYAVGLARQIETASDDEVRAQADAILLLDEMGWQGGSEDAYKLARWRSGEGGAACRCRQDLTRKPARLRLP